MHFVLLSAIPTASAANPGTSLRPGVLSPAQQCNVLWSCAETSEGPAAPCPLQPPHLAEVYTMR